jgi:hypothetical protein
VIKTFVCRKGCGVEPVMPRTPARHWFPSGAALWFVHPGSFVQPLPSITGIATVLDLIGSTFVPGPLLGK